MARLKTDTDFDFSLLALQALRAGTKLPFGTFAFIAQRLGISRQRTHALYNGSNEDRDSLRKRFEATVTIQI